MMDQFKQLLTSPFSGSRPPGRQIGTESCHHCGERGHSKMECPNYGVKQNGNSTIKLKRDYSGGRSESPQIKLGLSVVESVPQGRVAEIAIIGPGVCARDREGNREPSVSVQVKAEIESEQCSVSDKEATPSGGLDCYLLKCLANILRHGAPGLDHSLLPGGYLLVEEILKRDPGFARYSLPDIHKLVTVDVDRRFTLIKDSDSGCWKIRANQGYSFIVDTPAIPLVEKCEVPQGNLDTLALLTGDQEGPVANIVRGPNGAILAIENNSSIQKVAAPTETTSASDEEAQESWDSTSDSEAHTTLVEGANDEKIVTVFPTPVVDGGMTDNTENSHSPPIEDPSSTGETDRKAATESNNPVNQESVYINPESPDLGLGLLFKTGNVGTRYFNQQKPPPVDSGASVFCVSTVRSGPNRRQWDPGIPYPNKGIKTVQVRKNETKLFTMENGSAQLPGSNYIVDMQPLNGPVLVCIKTGKSWYTIQTRTIHSCLGSQLVGNPLY
ncbi:TPT1 [Mytilus edulis]|uniref:2'-phosphotransferase n=1 Tax=Mytilus edulis TaxID=6550 RepID=A0A8S3U020_MYTED|nr:TPT1 [Mytilus edulis]